MPLSLKQARRGKVQHAVFLDYWLIQKGYGIHSLTGNEDKTGLLRQSDIQKTVYVKLISFLKLHRQ